MGKSMWPQQGLIISPYSSPEEILISCGLIQVYQPKISKKFDGVCRSVNRMKGGTH